MNDKAALGHRLRGTDTAHFHLYARWISFPASEGLGSLLFALFIGQSSAFQYGKSKSHSNITIGSHIQRAIIQLIIHSFCLELESAGLMRFISCVINMFYSELAWRARLKRGKGNMRGSDPAWRGRSERELNERKIGKLMKRAVHGQEWLMRRGEAAIWTWWKSLISRVVHFPLGASRAMQNYSRPFWQTL